MISSLMPFINDRTFKMMVLITEGTVYKKHQFRRIIAYIFKSYIHRQMNLCSQLLKSHIGMKNGERCCSQFIRLCAIIKCFLRPFAIIFCAFLPPFHICIKTICANNIAHRLFVCGHKLCRKITNWYAIISDFRPSNV